MQPARARRSRWPRQLASRPTASRRSTSPGRASSTSPSPPAPRARWRPTSSRRVRRTAAPRRSPGSKINVEFISANPTGPLHLGHTRWAAVGDAIARVLDAAGAEVDPRVLHQRPRRPDGPVRRLGRCAAALGQPVPGGRLPRCLHRRPRHGGRGRAARASSSCPTTSALVAFRRGGYALQLAEQQQQLEHVPHPLRRLVLRAVPARRAGRSPRTSRGCGARATSTTRTARCGCAPTDFGRRQGPGADPVRRRADLLRLRHGLLPRQACARLRRLHLPARRRPPRLRRPAAGDGGLRRRRPDVQPRGADRPAGQDHAGRRRS